VKKLIFSLGALACVPGFTQVQIPSFQRYVCVLVEKGTLKCQGTDGGSPAAQDYAKTARVGDLWFPDGSRPITLTLKANHINSDLPEMRRLSGNVEIDTTKLELKADEAVYYPETGEIEARGNVRVRQVP
jgi:lipopolysaccharide assembly outer membrane protein LptD (OstA)